MPFLPQDLIHQLEMGGGRRYFRIGLAVLALVMLIVGYNWRAFRNMSAPEAMDAAQVARNLAEGRGFTTFFIRPLSMFLLEQHNREKHQAQPAGQAADPMRVKGPHPDLANPPVYPVVLAGLMKVLPFHFDLPRKPAPFWSNNGGFWRYQPDFLIALFNQALFLGVVALVFFLARRLFDPGVAALSAVLLLGSELFWRFSVSGLSTVLLLLLFLGLVWCLTLFEEENREPRRGPSAVYVLAALAGGLTGLGGLTRYAFGWLILPVLVFVLFCASRRRLVLGLTAGAAFLLVLTPWVARNYTLCGAPFGTASFALYGNSSLFPEYRLERSLTPEFTASVLFPFWQKLMLNARQLVQNDLPKLGGTWLSAFFLVGLMVRFNKPGPRRLRYFVLACLLVLALVQVLGRTQLSEDSPELTTENLLVLVTPLVLVYGVSLFYLLLEQVLLTMPFPVVRYGIISGFVVVVSLPLLLVFLPPRTIPVAYPPYYPPAIQTVAAYTKPDELTMSDIPWGMAWYGQRPCVWLTLKPEPDFFTIHDYQKPIQALMLTPVTMDARLLSRFIRDGDRGWGQFIFGCLTRRTQGLAGPPPAFPLHYWQPGWPEQFVLTYRDRPANRNAPPEVVPPTERKPKPADSSKQTVQ
jgi:hypothetical protein